ncbi:Hypothetical predicted protein [Olea europaea subsp. europaea]|uniref:Uncharacterized protein n=1 Tax=Olea europaea subsp. europaea TaxID=158383 RepID=A0A8S0PUF7_OLEEU|nr:Hypothetical predicted protein [Olea europaea subsp. europaea]
MLGASRNGHHLGVDEESQWRVWLLAMKVVAGEEWLLEGFERDIREESSTRTRTRRQRLVSCHGPFGVHCSKTTSSLLESAVDSPSPVFVEASIGAVEALKDQGVADEATRRFCNCCIANGLPDGTADFDGASMRGRAPSPGASSTLELEVRLRLEFRTRTRRQRLVSGHGPLDVHCSKTTSSLLESAVDLPSPVFVAASIGSVEALKDQGVCMWNYPLRLLHNQARKNLKSYYRTQILPPTGKFPSSTATAVVGKMKRREKSTEKVMDFIC